MGASIPGLAADEAQAGKTHQGWLQGKFSHRSSHSPACCLHTSVARCGIRQVSPNALTPRAASTHTPCSSPKGDSLPPPSALAGSQDPEPQQLSELPTLPPLPLPFSATCTTGACALNLSARIRVRSRSPLPSTEPVGAARPRLPRQVMGDGVRQGWHSTAEGWVAAARTERIPPSLPTELGLGLRGRDGMERGKGCKRSGAFLPYMAGGGCPSSRNAGCFGLQKCFFVILQINVNKNEVYKMQHFFFFLSPNEPG